MTNPTPSRFELGDPLCLMWRHAAADVHKRPLLAQAGRQRVAALSRSSQSSTRTASPPSSARLRFRWARRTPSRHRRCRRARVPADRESRRAWRRCPSCARTDFRRGPEGRCACAPADTRAGPECRRPTARTSPRREHEPAADRGAPFIRGRFAHAITPGRFALVRRPGRSAPRPTPPAARRQHTLDDDRCPGFWCDEMKVARRQPLDALRRLERLDLEPEMPVDRLFVAALLLHLLERDTRAAAARRAAIRRRGARRQTAPERHRSPLLAQPPLVDLADDRVVPHVFLDGVFECFCG